jgi:lipopolysaccharide assembly protein A
MRAITWIINGLLFILALGFAIKNTSPTELRFFLFTGDYVWNFPLVIYLLAFFVAGVVVGLSSVIPAYFRGRREIAKLRKDIKLSAKATASANLVSPPKADVVLPVPPMGGF